MEARNNMIKNKIRIFGIGAVVLLIILMTIAPIASSTQQNKIKEILREKPYDYCCFPPGTKITMADGTCKNIEDIRIGERVMSYEIANNRLTSWTVRMLGDPIHPVFNINDGLIQATVDHPLRIKKQCGQLGWGVLDTVKGKYSTRLKEDVLAIKVGDQLFTEDGRWVEVVKINIDPKPVQTYNIMSYSGRHNYFANGILVYEENPYYILWMKYYVPRMFERFLNNFPVLQHIL